MTMSNTYRVLWNSNLIVSKYFFNKNLMRVKNDIVISPTKDKTYSKVFAYNFLDKKHEDSLLKCNFKGILSTLKLLVETYQLRLIIQSLLSSLRIWMNHIVKIFFLCLPLNLSEISGLLNEIADNATFLRLFLFCNRFCELVPEDKRKVRGSVGLVS